MLARLFSCQMCSFIHPYPAAASAVLFFAWAAPIRAELAQQSPFLPPNAVTPDPRTMGAGPIELRGTMSTSDGPAYCIFEKGKKASAWVRLNEPGYDFVVKSAGPGGDQVAVEYEGQTFHIALRSAKVLSESPVPTSTTSNGRSDLANPLLPIDGADPTPAQVQERMRLARAESLRRRLETMKAARDAQNSNQPPDGPSR